MHVNWLGFVNPFAAPGSVPGGSTFAPRAFGALAGGAAPGGGTFNPRTFDSTAALAAALANSDGDAPGRLSAALFAPRFGAGLAPGNPAVERSVFAPRFGPGMPSGDPVTERSVFTNRTLGAQPFVGDAATRIASQVFGGRPGVSLTATGVTPGTYTLATVTVDANGRILSASNGSAAIGAGVLRGYIDGLITSRASTTTVTVAAGTARDSTDAYMLYLSAATTKTLQSSGAWTAGTGNNGLDTGARAVSTCYHVWVIAKADGTSVDVLFSLSATAPTMPSTYTLKRRIGSIGTTGGGLVTSYIQVGDRFDWDVPTIDVSATNPGVGAVTRTASVPTGISVTVLVTVGLSGALSTDNAGSVYLSPLDVSDTAPVITTGASTLLSYNGGAVLNQDGITYAVRTNTSGQYRSRLQISGTTTVLYLGTLGWIDKRDRDL